MTRPAANHVSIEDAGPIAGEDPEEVAIEFLMRVDIYLRDSGRHHHHRIPVST